METLRVRVRRGVEASDLPLPEPASEHASGADLRSSEAGILQPGEIRAFGTGLSVEIPGGYEFQVRPRSGLALKSGITVLNTPGTIDADYRGEIRVILYNASRVAFEVRRGDRIAQMVLAPVVRAVWEEARELEETARQEGGFGSTGLG